MNLEILLSLLGTLLGFLISLFTLVLKLSKNKKIRRTTEQMLCITDKINTFIVEAEQFKNYTGVEKKNYVLTKLNQFSMDHKIKFDSEVISNKIEEIMALTKKVNIKEIGKDWL